MTDFENIYIFFYLFDCKRFAVDTKKKKKKKKEIIFDTSFFCFCSIICVFEKRKRKLRELILPQRVV